MIGLDTNVLVRYLTQDDPAQAAKAGRVIENAEAASLFLSVVVVCEMVWVLEDAYGRKRSEIANIVERIIQTGQFLFEDKDLLWQALNDYRGGKGDLSDYIIGRAAIRAGASHTLTFDNGLKDSSVFHLL